MVFTGYFAHYRGSCGVSVANSVPKGTEYEVCEELKPDWEMVKSYKDGLISWKEFRKAYIKRLKALDVKEFYNRLNGKVLLCWEKPGNHCHRDIIREWFNRNGYACEELEPTREIYSCSYCKYLNNHHSSSICCEVTGEILTNAEQQARTCEDWRYCC